MTEPTVIAGQIVGQSVSGAISVGVVAGGSAALQPVTGTIEQRAIVGRIDGATGGGSGGGPTSADQVSFDDTAAQLGVGTVQGAIDALAGFTVLDPARPVYPEDIDSYAGASINHDWSAAIDTALGECVSTGGKRIMALRPGRLYATSKSHLYDPTTTTLRGQGAGISAHIRNFDNPAIQTEMTVNGGFASTSGWIAGAENVDGFTISGGKLRHDATGSFAQEVSAAPIAMVAGRKYRIRIKIDSITAVTVGINTYRSVIFYLRSGSTGGGTSFFKREIRSTDADYAPGGIITLFHVATASGNAYLRWDAQAGVEVDSVSIVAEPDNAIFKVEASRAVGHMAHEISDLFVRGTLDASKQNFVRLFEMATQTEGWSSRMRVSGLNTGTPLGDVGGGIGTVFYMGRRTYLVDIDKGRMSSSYAFLETEPGAQAFDAGENIRVLGGSCGGGKYGVLNPTGMAITLDGTSIDFVQSFYTGVGGFTGDNVWLECKVADFVDPDVRLIDVQGGFCDIKAKTLQVDNYAGAPFHPAPFRVAKNARLDIDAMNPYALRGTTGALCDGDGEFNWRGRGGVAKNIDSVTKRDTVHNLWGSGFASPAVAIPAWLSAGAGQQQIGPRKIGYAASGTFVGTTTRGSQTITGVAPGGYTNIGTVITDPGFPVGTTVTDYVSGTQVMTVSQRRNAAGGSAGVGFQLADSDAARSTITMEPVGDGTYAVTIVKRGVGKGVATIAYLAARVEAGRAFGCEISYQVLGGLTGTGDLYLQSYFAQITGIASDSPTIAPVKQYITEQSETGIDMAAGVSGSWTFGTNTLATTAQHSGHAPHWSDGYVLIPISLINLPNGATVKLTLGHANLM